MMLTGNMESGPVSELVLGLLFACILVEHLLTVSVGNICLLSWILRWKSEMKFGFGG